MRIVFLCAVLGLFFVGPGDCLGQEATLTLVLAPVYDAILQGKECTPMVDFLSTRLKVRVALRVVADERELVEGFVAGKFQFGLLGPGVIERTRRRRAPYTIVAAQVLNKRSHYRALLLARGMENPSKLEELYGRACAWGPARSYSLSRLADSLRRGGFDPVRSLRRRMFRSHLDALVSAVEGKYNVVAVSELAMKVLRRVGKGKAKLHPVLKGPRVPFDAFVISRSLDEAIREQVILAILAYKYFTPVERAFVEWRPCSDGSYLRR